MEFDEENGATSAFMETLIYVGQLTCDRSVTPSQQEEAIMDAARDCPPLIFCSTVHLFKFLSKEMVRETLDEYSLDLAYQPDSLTDLHVKWSENAIETANIFFKEQNCPALPQEEVQVCHHMDLSW